MSRFSLIPACRTFHFICAASCLICLFSFLNLYFLTPTGPHVVGDGVGYVRSADQLVQGQPFPTYAWTRLGYVLLIAASRTAGLGLWGVIALQIALAALAGLAAFDLGRGLSGTWAGLFSAAVLLANPDIVRWHSYLHTESFYTSAVVLSVWSTLRAAERGRWWYLLAAACLALAALLRPNGWLLVLLAPCHWLAVRLSDRRMALAAAGGLALAFVGGFFLLLTARPNFLTSAPDAMFRRGEVIWGHPASRLPMPDDPGAANVGLPGALEYAVRNPVACARLAATRVFTELLHTRPFYSRKHNAAILAVLPALYALALVGLVSSWRTPAVRFLAAVIAAHLSIQAVNYADWDGRFLLYVLPLIGVLASAGLARVGSWIGQYRFGTTHPMPNGKEG